MQLSKLLTTALDLLKGGQSLHFSSLSIINRIIDICIVFKHHKVQQHQSTTNNDTIQIKLGENQPRKSPKHRINQSTQCCTEETTGASNAFQRISSIHLKKHSSEGAKEKIEDGEEVKLGTLSSAVLKDPLEMLISCDPSQILSVLHNSITMHKRIIGTRQKCTPSTRWQHCTHHCLQILSARILAVMVHGSHCQYRIIVDGHIKTLVEALDPNHDPVSSDDDIRITFITVGFQASALDSLLT